MHSRAPLAMYPANTHVGALAHGAVHAGWIAIQQIEREETSLSPIPFSITNTSGSPKGESLENRALNVAKELV